MVGSSILPVAFHRGQVYFLFGKESPMEKSAKGFSDFGGGMEEGETPLDTALREGGEELTGFLGDASTLKRLIENGGGVMHLSHGEGNTLYHVHMFRIVYDPMLPVYYNRNHSFLWERMDHKMLHNTRLFEKIEIAWMTPQEMKKRIKEFRPFYRAIVEHILSELPAIKSRFHGGSGSGGNKNRKTKKNREEY